MNEPVWLIPLSMRALGGVPGPPLTATGLRDKAEYAKHYRGVWKVEEATVILVADKGD